MRHYELCLSFSDIKFQEQYQYINAWVVDGWVETGQSEGSQSMVRAFDEGGMVFEGKNKYPSMEAALTDLDQGIQKWCEETGIEFDLEYW